MADPVARYDCAARSKMDKDFYFETGTFILKQGIGIESLRLSGKEKFMIRGSAMWAAGVYCFGACQV